MWQLQHDFNSYWTLATVRLNQKDMLNTEWHLLTGYNSYCNTAHAGESV